MKVKYTGQQTLSFDGILLTPGIHEMPEAHVEKLKAHPKAVAMEKEGMIEFGAKSESVEEKVAGSSEEKSEEQSEGVVAKVFKGKKK